MTTEQPNPLVRAAIYLRISQDKTGEAAGVDRQREDCLNLVTGQGWALHEVYVDNDISATSGKARPDYRRMLRDIQAGHIDAVVAWHPDRLYRKLPDLEELIAAIEAKSVVMRTVRAGEIDLSTPTGRMLARILSATAQAEGEMKSDRWKRSVRQRREQGRVPGSGSRMYGYAWDGAIVPEEAEHTRWMAQMVLEGVPLNQLARMIRDRDIRTTKGNLWSGASLRAYLRNPRLAGHSSLGGDIIGRGTWEPILDDETWESVRAILTARSGRRQPGRSLLTGLIYCGRCDQRMFAGARMNKRKETVRVYRCRRGINFAETACGAVSGRADTIEEIVEAYAAARLASPKVREAIQRLRATPQVVVAEITETEARIQELEHQLDSPGVPVEVILRAIDRAKERRDALLGSVVTTAPREIPEVVTAWPAEPARRRALIELVVAKVTIAPTVTVGLFDPERVRIEGK